MEKALSAQDRNLATLKLSWCFILEETLAEKEGNEVLIYNSNLGIYPGKQKDFYMQREFARSAACTLNTSIARIGSTTGRSTNGGHQMAEETCK